MKFIRINLTLIFIAKIVFFYATENRENNFKFNSKCKIAKELNLKAEKFQQSSPEKMLSFSLKAIKISNDCLLIKAKAFQNAGIAKIILGDYKKSIFYLNKSKEIFENLTIKQKDLDDLAKTYGTIGVVYSEQGDYGKGLTNYLKALKIYRRTKNIENKGRIYNNVGISYLNLENLNKSLSYFNKCKVIQEKLNDPTIAITLTNIGNIYSKKNELNKAFFYYNLARKKYANYHNPRGLGELYNNIGLFYQKSRDLKQAEIYFNKAIKIFNSINDKFGVSDTYYYLGENLLAQKEYNSAIENIQYSNRLSKELGVLAQVKRAEKKLFEIYHFMRKDSQALKHYLNYSQIKDSLQNLKNIKNNIRAELNFEYEKKLFIEKKEKEKKALVYSEKLKRNELKMIFISFFLIALFIFSFLLYKRRQTNKTLNLKLNLIELEQKALHLQMNPHFVFNCLGSISSFILQSHTDEAIKYLSKFSKLMRHTLEFSKVPLIPIDKEIESLENYLELEKLRFFNQFDYEITKSDDIEDDVHLPSMLIQPFVENAIIHGVVPKKLSGKISINFMIKEDNLICEIKDNGVGIHYSKRDKDNKMKVHESLALKIIEKRLSLMEESLGKKTKLKIEELKDEGNIVLGTKVHVEFPLQYL